MLERFQRDAPSTNQPKNRTMKLNEILKGMKVKDWEVRENSNGKKVVYVHFIPAEKPITVNVK